MSIAVTLPLAFIIPICTYLILFVMNHSLDSEKECGYLSIYIIMFLTHSILKINPNQPTNPKYVDFTLSSRPAKRGYGEWQLSTGFQFCMVHGCPAAGQGWL